MDLGADAGIPSPHTTAGGSALEQEMSLSSAGCRTESGGPLLLQLLEFKTHLFEAVEELHIRKDAETRFEDQISKLMLEKQELEWEKESLQHRIETVETQHTVSLTSVKQQFQVKIRHLEEEKGKYQVSAELKDKEINNLKEEVKSLQLLKYNLENKSNELEQKLLLQSRAKDSHLNQLGEVEKRFSALSRHCAMVKQAHEKLEQNVDEAMRINKKLTSANEKQEATIVSLKKELEEVSNNVIKDKMTSFRCDKTNSDTGKEQHLQKLHQKLNMETEMNMKLREENVAVRAEKQEVMRSLQRSQQLLLSQTQAVNRVELELQTQREQYQALKQEHEVMRDKSKAMEDKVAQLMESYAASKTSWDKEKKIFQDCIKNEQQDLQAVREAYDELRQKHTELSSLAKAQAQHIFELEMRNSSQSMSVLTHPPNEPISTSELPGFVSLQHLASSETRNPDCLEDTGAATYLDATGATGGQGTQNHYQQSSNLFTCPITNTHLNPCTQPGTKTLSIEHMKSSKTSESDSDAVTDLLSIVPSVTDDNLLLSKGTTSVSSPDHRSINALLGSPSKDKNEGGNRGMREEKHGGKDDGGQQKNNRKQEERSTEQQWNTAKAQGEDAEEGRSTGETRGRLVAQTTDRTDRHEESQGSAEDARDTRNPETETRERAERGETPSHTSERPETQILSQTAEKNNTRQVVDFVDAESPQAVCAPSDCSHSLSQEVTDEDPDSSHVTNGSGTVRGPMFHTFGSDDSQSVYHGPHPVTEVQNQCHNEVRAQDAEPLLPNPIHQVSEKTTESTDKSAAELSDPLSLSAQTAPNNLSNFTSNMKQTDEPCDIHVNKECVELEEPQLLPESQDMSEQETGQVKSLVTDDDDDNYDGDSNTYVKDRHENYDETLHDPMEKSTLKDVCVDITMDAVDPDSEVESRSCQDQMKSDKTDDTRAAHTHLKPSAHPTGTRSSFGLVSFLHHFVQGSEQNTSGSGGRLRHPPSTTPMFTKSKRTKVPLVITRASGLLNASSVCGNAASSMRHQQGEWKALGETCRETTAAHTVSYTTCCEESRASLPFSSFPISPSPTTVSELSWQATPGCSRAPTSVAGPVSESDWELCCSQKREDQQSSFRAQISKIEQFLNTERLRLPKRQRTDD